MSEAITAEQFREAVKRSARPKTELAQMLGVERTLIYWYEKNGVTRARAVEKVKQVMGLWLSEGKPDAWSQYSDEELLNEVRRRMGRSQPLLTGTEGDAEVSADTTEETPIPEGGAGRYTGSGGPS